MATLLLELFSEEIPSRMQRGAAEQLQRLITAGFEKNGLAATDIKTFVSPRHLAIQCFGLPTIQPDVKEEKRGPKIGAPEQAMKGFLHASGMSIEQLEQRDGYYYATIERKGRAVAEVVKEVCESALTAFGWPKSMRWGSRPLSWVRPLHRIVCLLDKDIVPVQFAHLSASNITEGHRFLAPKPITIPHAESYVELLQNAYVIVDYATRKETIRAGVAALAAKQKLALVDDEGLLDEVTGLVEWPVPLLGSFEEKFLALPPEVLISEMKNHQRYFALRTADGKLANQFITVANMVNADGGKKVIAGNSRVVRARLSDGEFYWEQDRKTSLEDWGKKLSDVVFHADVGMMSEKVERIVWLSLLLANALKVEDLSTINRAALLAKADLTSGMVGEFPELQGIMGRYYASAQGEKTDVADAIRDHYKPLGANDSIPESSTAAIVSIADKIDSIATLFAADAKPTGSKDPFALRRAALGMLKTLLGKNYNFNLAPIIRSAAYFASNATNSVALKLDKEWILEEHADALLRGEIDFSNLGGARSENMQLLLDSATHEVITFLSDRLKTILRDEGLRHDVVEVSIASSISDFNPLAISTNARDIAAWTATSSGKESLAAIKRAMNILAAEEKKSKTTFAASTSGAAEPSEKAIAAALAEVQKNTAAGPACLEALTAPINQFFTDLLVTEEGKREARLALLAAVRDAANQIADFSKIEG